MNMMIIRRQHQYFSRLIQDTRVFVSSDRFGHKLFVLHENMLPGNALQSSILDLQSPPILELITMAIIKECKQGRCTGACASGQRLGRIDPSIDVCPGFPPRPSHPDHLGNSVPESQLEMRPMWNHNLTECGRCIKG